MRASAAPQGWRLGEENHRGTTNGTGIGLEAHAQVNPTDALESAVNSVATRSGGLPRFVSMPKAAG